MFYLRLFVLLIASSFLFSCDEESDSAGNPSSKIIDRILIPNYGIWGSEPGSLSEYNFAKDSLYRDVYLTANGVKMPKGVQSVVLSGSKLFVTCVDDNLILILDSKTYKETGRIKTGDFSGPNYLTNGSDGNLYFTQTNGSVCRLNPVTFEITLLEGSLQYPGELRSVSGKLYVTDNGFWPDFGNALVIFNQATGKTEKTLRVGKNPSTLAVHGSELAVFCAGDYASVYGGIYLVNTASDQVTDSVKFEGSFPFSRLSFSPDGMLYYNDSGVKSIPVNSGKFGTLNCFSAQSGHPFFAEGSPSVLFLIQESKDSRLDWLNNGAIVRSYPLGQYANGTALVLYQ